MSVLPLICINQDCRTVYFTNPGDLKANSPDKPAMVSAPYGDQLGFGGRDCPNCGSQGCLPAGKYEFDFKDNDTDKPARFISGPLSTKAILDQAQILMAVLRQSKNQKQAEVIAALETVSPAIADISRQTADKFTYKDWINLLIQLLALFIAIQQAYFKKEDKSSPSSGIKSEYVELLIKENNELRVKQQVQAVLSKVRRPVKQQAAKATHTGRNQLCPCNSGKKFKRCHGIS